jgi:hypothetical protein
VTLTVTADWDIVQAHACDREAVVEQATLEMWRRDKAQSAAGAPPRSAGLWLVLAAIVAGPVLAPRTTLVALLAVISLAFLFSLVQVVVCMVGVRQENHVR